MKQVLWAALLLSSCGNADTKRTHASVHDVSADDPCRDRAILSYPDNWPAGGTVKMWQHIQASEIWTGYYDKLTTLAKCKPWIRGEITARMIDGKITNAEYEELVRIESERQDADELKTAKRNLLNSMRQ